MPVISFLEVMEIFLAIREENSSKFNHNFWNQNNLSLICQTQQSAFIIVFKSKLYYRFLNGKERDL